MNVTAIVETRISKIKFTKFKWESPLLSAHRQDILVVSEKKRKKQLKNKEKNHEEDGKMKSIIFLMQSKNVFIFRENKLEFQYDGENA